MEFLLEPPTYAFFQRALLASFRVGGLCGLVGVYIVLHGMSYIGHGLSHAVFVGAGVSVLHQVNFYLEAGLWLLKTRGSAEHVLAMDDLLQSHSSDWFVRETTGFLRRTLSRLDVSSRSMFAVIEPGSCFAGTLAELNFAADRSYMLIGQLEGDNRPGERVTPTLEPLGQHPSRAQEDHPR